VSRILHIALRLGAGAAAAALLVPAASAAKVNWNENAKDGKVPVMNFQIESFTFTARSWSAHVSVKNLSKTTIKIGNEFGAAIYSDDHTTNLDDVIGFATADSFEPARPTELKPGASWSGVISGTGTLKSSQSARYARVVFGPLTGLPGQSKPVFWVTDHWLTLQPTGGLVI
jgi:hypothetical protein